MIRSLFMSNPPSFTFSSPGAFPVSCLVPVSALESFCLVIPRFI